MYLVVTGAAGFIGSNLVRALNARGERNIIAVDNLTSGDKFRNLVDCEISDFLDKEDFIREVRNGRFDGALDAVLHQGACSDTMQSDGRYMMENNYRYSCSLLDFCLQDQVPLIYASSAAVYGGGTVFRESREHESPLNVYGYSKFLFDQVVRARALGGDVQVAGFRYFNVYGPREQHKARMASVAWHFFNQYQAEGKVRPFAGSGGYANGEQRRDFVSVEDVVKVNLFFLDHPELSGIFNLGSGRAQSFNDVACATVNACRVAAGKPALELASLQAEGIIEYRAFPKELEGKYQSYTEADISALRNVGYAAPMLSVEQGVTRYVEQLRAGLAGPAAAGG